MGFREATAQVKFHILCGDDKEVKSPLVDGMVCSLLARLVTCHRLHHSKQEAESCLQLRMYDKNESINPLICAYLAFWHSVLLHWTQQLD